MSVYVDSSALIKRYVDEPDGETAEAILLADVDRSVSIAVTPATAAKWAYALSETFVH